MAKVNVFPGVAVGKGDIVMASSSFGEVIFEIAEVQGNEVIPVDESERVIAWSIEGDILFSIPCAECSDEVCRVTADRCSKPNGRILQAYMKVA